MIVPRPLSIRNRKEARELARKFMEEYIYPNKPWDNRVLESYLPNGIRLKSSFLGKPIGQSAGQLGEQAPPARRGRKPRVAEPPTPAAAPAAPFRPNSPASDNAQGEGIPPFLQRSAPGGIVGSAPAPDAQTAAMLDGIFPVNK